MKIVVTYEKKDILRLIEKDLEAQNIKVKQGTSLEYKGALSIKFEVETEDDLRAKHSKPVVKDKTEPEIEQPETPVDMANVVRESQVLVKTRTGKFEVKHGSARVLGPNESLEFPKGD